MKAVEKKRTINLLGREIEATEVDIVERSERPAEYKLEDGSVIKFAVVPTAVLRIDGQWNADGSPIYIVLNGQAVTVVSARPALKRPA